MKVKTYLYSKYLSKPVRFLFIFEKSTKPQLLGLCVWGGDGGVFQSWKPKIN